MRDGTLAYFKPLPFEPRHCLSFKFKLLPLGSFFVEGVCEILCVF